MSIDKIVVHNSGGLLNQPYASTQNLTAEDVDAAHRLKWGLQSTLGRWGGYTFFINKLGVLTQFRAIGEEQAAQKGHNLNTISICLAGNFSSGVDRPTFEQEIRLKNLIYQLLQKNFEGLVVLPGVELNLELYRIIPHRVLNSTNCYGNSLKDDWARNLIVGIYQEKIGILQKILNAYTMLLNILKYQKLGAVVPSSCMFEDNQDE